MTTLTEELAKPEYAGLTDRQTADAINAMTVSVPAVGSFIGIGSVLSALGAEAGAALLDRLEALTATVPAIKWAMRLLDTASLDIGLEVTRQQIDALCAAGVMSTAERDALKALGETDAPYSSTLRFDRVIDPADIQTARGG